MATARRGKGPLVGLRVIELAGIGPAPFCGMLLADLGADVIRVDRVDAPPEPPEGAVLARGRRSIAVDLKGRAGVEVVLRLVEGADVLMEGFRPGVAERLGLGPEACLERNPQLVYGRMTGWGQEGPYARVAGHDINYIALAGALEPIGRAGEAPVPPLNLVGDFGGGGMLLALGILAAIHETQRSGAGQVIDAAMVDGAATLMNVFWSLKAEGSWNPERGTNLLDSGAPFYDVYRCADGGYVSIGSIEPQFYAELLRLTGLSDDPFMADQHDRSRWPEMKRRVAEVFASRTRDEWCELLERTEVCFAPVLSPEDARRHPHNEARGTFVEVFGQVQTAPAPRFSRTPGEIQGPPVRPGEHSAEILQEIGLGDRGDELRATRAIR